MRQRGRKGKYICRSDRVDVILEVLGFTAVVSPLSVGMAVQCGAAIPARFPAVAPSRIPRRSSTEVHFCTAIFSRRCRTSGVRVLALDRTEGGGSSSNEAKKKPSVPNSNYVVPLDKSSCITRPLAEILRDLNKRIPDNIIKTDDFSATFIPWYHANRMLSFYAPGWCGEIRDVIFADSGSVTVVYRVTIRGSDGEAHREATGTVSPGNTHILDPVAAAEEIAFCRACARFGLGLYLYHRE